MSKYVKNLLTDHFRERLDGVADAVLVDVIGLDANKTSQLRGELEAKNIQLLVIKNSLAARATAGTSLEPMLTDLAGTAALCFGGEDIVSLAKEVVRLEEDGGYAPFAARGGAMDGGSPHRRAGETGQQMAQPGRTAQPIGWPDSRPWSDAFGPAYRPGRGSCQPDQAKSGRRGRGRGRGFGRIGLVSGTDPTI